MDDLDRCERRAGLPCRCDNEDDFYEGIEEGMDCPTCRGNGTVNPLTAPPNYPVFTTTTCPTCDGTGSFWE